MKSRRRTKTRTGQVYITNEDLDENHKRPENFFPARAAFQIEEGLLETVTPSWEEIQR